MTKLAEFALLQPQAGEIGVVPNPRAACRMRGQYLGLVSASGI